MGFSPESPRWQHSKGDFKAATTGATRLWGDAGSAALEETAGGSQKTEPVSVGELLQSKGAIIGVALFAAQQLSGINAVVYFSSATFAAVSHHFLSFIILALSPLYEARAFSSDWTLARTTPDCVLAQ